MTYLSDIYSMNNSGILTIKVPQVGSDDTNNYPIVEGILQEDLQIQMGNNFNPVSELNDALNKVQQFQEVFNANNLLNYIPASGMAWQGSAHIKVSAVFYLVTLNAKSNIMGKIHLLSQLCAVRATDSTSARIHGGYRMELQNASDVDNLFNNNKSLVNDDGSITGTCTLQVGNTTIRGLLATSLQFSPSNVLCRNGEPLYYNVGMSFTGFRAPTFKDLEPIFGKGGN